MQHIQQNEMEPIANSQGAVFDVIEATNLEWHTSHGWQLVGVLPCTVEIALRRTPPLDSGLRHAPAITIPEYGIGHRFLIRKSIDTIVDELRSKISGQQTEIARLSKCVTDAEETIKKAEKTKADRDQTITELRSELAAATARDKHQQQSFRKIEGDLAKVRKEIGDREWARIIGDGSMPSGSR